MAIGKWKVSEDTRWRIQATGLVALVYLSVITWPRFDHVVTYVCVATFILMVLGGERLKKYALMTAIFIPLFVAMLVSLAVDVPRQIEGRYDRLQSYLNSPVRKAKISKRAVRPLSG